MSSVDLDTELRRRAEKAAEAIMQEARAEAARLLAEADRRIADRRREAMEDKEAECRAEARVAIAAARHEAMRDLLLARTRVVDRVIDRARDLLPEAAMRETYVSGVAEGLAEALEFVDSRGAVVRCSEGLEPTLREALESKPGVALKPEAALGPGFILVGPGGLVQVDARLETRIDQLASELAIEIHARLGEA